MHGFTALVTGYQIAHGAYPRYKESDMLTALIVILLVLAVVGGVAIHPLLFLLALLALFAFFGGRGRSTVP